jgi:uncharacterized protein YndB with AHSA1/START domain
MLEKITIRVSVSASIQKVWEYYTNPIHITQWNFAHPSWHCPSASNDMQVGGRYIARMEARDGSAGFDFEATYTEIHANESFSYEFGGRMAVVKFSDKDGATELTLTFDPENENPIEMQRNGWQSILDNFKKYAESHS